MGMKNARAMPAVVLAITLAGCLSKEQPITVIADGAGSELSNNIAPTISGSPDDIRVALSRYEGVVDSIKLTPPTHGLSPDEVRSAQAQVIQLIGELTGGRS